MNEKVLCWACKNRMRVPGSAHIACAWRREGNHHVNFFEGFDPNYPNPVFECEGFEEGDLLEEVEPKGGER